MNVDHILGTLNQCNVRYLLIGGMNFMLRHQPILTYDVDLWIEDQEENRRRTEAALSQLDAQWGVTDDDWGEVAQLASGWLDRQALFCLTSPHGAIDVFRSVAGLDDWETCWNNSSIEEATAAGTPYRGLSDEDMLLCQLALAVESQKKDRILKLRDSLDRKN